MRTAHACVPNGMRARDDTGRMVCAVCGQGIEALRPCPSQVTAVLGFTEPTRIPCGLLEGHTERRHRYEITWTDNDDPGPGPVLRSPAPEGALGSVDTQKRLDGVLGASPGVSRRGALCCYCLEYIEFDDLADVEDDPGMKWDVCQACIDAEHARMAGR